MTPRARTGFCSRRLISFATMGRRMADYKPLICIDFDGVIHGYQSGWKGAHRIPDPPVPGAIEALLRYLDAGFDVAIFSSRSKSILGRMAMKRWLGREIANHWTVGFTPPSLAEAECWGDAASAVNRFKWPWFKPASLITIDDRALTFNGNWGSPQYRPDALRSFKPWNKLGAPRRPTVEELEAILRSDEILDIVINPDGSIRAVGKADA